MATLQKNYDYSNVLWEEIYQRIKTIIRDEYNVSPYISPELNTKINSPFRIWSDLEGTESLFVGGWHKMYTISINQYFKKEDSERFYQRLYQDSERLYQLFFNNQGTQEAELLGFFDGKPQEVSISEEDEYFRVEVIFTCNVFRHDDAIYVETSPSAIRAAIRAIEPSYNFWSLGFDGTDDSINAGSDSSIDDIWASGGTLSVWVNPLTTGNNQGICHKRGVGNDGWMLKFDTYSSGHVVRFSAVWDGSGQNLLYQASTDKIPVNKWTNIVVTYNSSSYLNAPIIYLNGQSITLTNEIGGTIYQPSNGDSYASDASLDFIIGNETSGGNNDYAGALSDLALFNTALSSSTIETMYNNGTPILLTRNQGSYNSSGNLVAYYRMGSGNSDDRNSRGAIFDQTDSSLGNDIIINGSFETQEDANTIGSSNGWFQRDSNNEYLGSLGGGTILRVGSGESYTGSGSGSINMRTTSATTLYIQTNGVSIDTTKSYKVVVTISYWDSSVANTIFRLNNGGGDFGIDDLVDGKITAYIRPTATYQRVQLSNSGSFTIDEITMQEVNPNVGILENFDGLDFKTNVPQIYDKALFSNSLVFDGTDDFIDCGSDSSIDNIFDGGGSISMWVYVHTLSGDNERLIDKKRVGYNGWFFSMKTLSSDSCKLFFNMDTTDVDYETTTNTQVVTLNQWHHIVLTYNSSSTSNRAIIYVDGNSVDLTVNSTPNNTREDDSGNKLTIGGQITSGGGSVEDAYDGLMSDVSLFNSILDQTNVTAIYNSGKPIDLTCDAGNYNNANNLVAYWKMGDGYLDELPSLSPGLIIDQVSPIIGEELVVDNPYVADYYQLYTNNTISTISGRSVTINLVDDNAGVKIYLNNTVYSNATGILKSNPIDNELYLVSIDVVSDGTGQLFLQNVVAGNVYSQVSGSGTHKFLFKEKPSASATIRIINFSAGGGTFMTWSNISVKKVEGNPGFTHNMNASSQSISVPT